MVLVQKLALCRFLKSICNKYDDWTFCSALQVRRMANFLYSPCTLVDSLLRLQIRGALVIFSVSYQSFQLKFLCIPDLLTVRGFMPWHLDLPVCTTIDFIRCWTLCITVALQNTRPR